MVRAGLTHCATTWFVYVAIALLAYGALRHYTPVSVAGGSMKPALAPGDLVIVERGRAPQAGEVVLIRASGHGQVLHRVRRILTRGVYLTRGDANTVADIAPVRAGDIVGTAMVVIPAGKLLDRWR